MNYFVPKYNCTCVLLGYGSYLLLSLYWLEIDFWTILQHQIRILKIVDKIILQIYENSTNID